MTRLLFALIAALLLTAPALAQIIPPARDALTAENDCATWSLPGNVPSATFQITGTFSGTITFRATTDAVTYADVLATKLSTGNQATTTTSTGQYAVSNTGWTHVRACMTTYASGGANVNLTRGYAMNATRNLFFTAGTGTATYRACGQLTASTTQLGNTADTLEQALWTYTMPGGTLAATGDRVIITAFGTFGATGNNKTLYAYYAGTALNSSTTTQNGGSWQMTWSATRASATSSKTMGDRVDAGTQRGWVYAAITATLADDQIIKMAGQSQTTGAANDVVFESASVQYCPAAA